MSTWPVALQQKLNVAGFQKRMGNTRVQSDNDVGPAKVRSRFTVAVDVYECEVWLDFDEVDDFETFYKTTLGNGTLPFDFNDPFTEAPASFRFVPGTDPVIRPVGSGGRTFAVSMSWEKMP